MTTEPDTSAGPHPLPEPVTVPDAWRARGFSGRYAAYAYIPTVLVERFAAAAPGLMRDQAWLLLTVEPPADGDPETAAARIIMVRLDAAALVDMTARRPSPGAYRPPQDT